MAEQRQAGVSEDPRSLEGDADLYEEIYRDDDDLHSLTEAALEGWPE